MGLRGNPQKIDPQKQLKIDSTQNRLKKSTGKKEKALKSDLKKQLEKSTHI